MERPLTRWSYAGSCSGLVASGTFCTAGLVSGVPMRDMQIAMRHDDPRTKGLYDMANNKARNAGHRVASFLAGMTG